MSFTIKEPVHHIISRMNDAEKKEFRQSINTTKKKTQLLILFDYFNTIEEVNEAHYKKFIARQQMAATAVVVKSQLKDKLINWLAAKSKAPDGTDWFYQLAKAEALSKFELYEDAYTAYHTVWTAAREKNMAHIEPLALTALSALCQILPPEQILPKAIEYSNRLVEINNKLSGLTAAHNYYLRTNLIFYETSTLNKATHYNMVVQLQRENFFRATEAFLPFEVLVYLFQSRSMIYQMMGEAENMYLESTKLYQLMMQYKDSFKTYQPIEYALVMRNQLRNALLSNHLKDYQELFTPLRQEIQDTMRSGRTYLLEIDSLQLLYYIKKSDRQTVEKELKRYEKYCTTPDYKLALVANAKEVSQTAAYAYLYTRQWSKAIDRLEQILNMRAKEVGVGFDHTAHFILLLTHTAQKLSDIKNNLCEPSQHLYNLSDSYYNYIIRNQLENPVEKIVVKYIKELAKGGSKKEQQQKIETMFDKIKKELKNPAPYYVMQLSEFNWVQWLESCIKH